MESKLQSKIIKWLKDKGAYVIKTKPGMGTPTGCPDVIFLFENTWGAIEVKASRQSKYGMGQRATLAHLGEWTPFVYTANPENWPEVKANLELHFF